MPNNKAHVLIIGSFLNLGGAQIALLRLARGLHDRGHKSKALFLYRRDQIDTPDFPYELLLEADRPGVRGYVHILRKLLVRLRTEGPESVLTFLPLANVMAHPMAFFVGIKRRIVSHRTPLNTTGMALRLVDLLWAWLGIYTDVVAVSESVRKTCRLYPPWLRRRIVVVHNGIRDWRPSKLSSQEARRELGISDESFVLVAVGRLAQQKNYPFLLRLLQHLNGILLLVAGDGPLRHDLEVTIRNLGVAGSVRLLGAFPHSKIPDVLAAADVFIQASSFEGHSNSVLEALQARVPIIASDIPEHRETIADTDGLAAGVLVPLHDPDAWIVAIEKMRNDPQAALVARAVADRRAGLFQYEKMINGFEQILLQSR